MKTMTMLMLAAMWLGGCYAGQDVTLKGGDAIKGAAQELRAGVNLYDTAIQTSISQMKVALYKAAVTEFSNVTTRPASSDTAEQKAASMLKAIDGVVTEESRRGELRTLMLSNLDFIEKVATDMQKLAVYSASVDAQIRDWTISQISVKAAAAKMAGTTAVKEK